MGKEITPLLGIKRWTIPLFSAPDDVLEFGEDRYRQAIRLGPVCRS
jgi:hypothetical protein